MSRTVGHRVVVGAAIVRDGRVLAARRTGSPGPPEAAGRWELPGGKVEAGEGDDEALVREIGEELACVVQVLDWLDGEVAVRDGLVLRIARVRLLTGEPRRGEHDQLRWLAADEFDDVDWLEPDRPFLPQLSELLGAGAVASLRGIFFDEAAARAVAARLVRDGWSATLTRERLAGEDDDEDHPWAVLTDAPEPVLDLLVDSHDGWLDDGGPAAPARTLPPELPRAPRH